MRGLTKTGSVVKGSVGQVAQARGISLEAAMLGCEWVVLIDQSGSMDEHDAAEGLTRREAANEELRKLQERYPGQIAVFEFADSVAFCPNGYPADNVGGRTDLAGALRFLRPLIDGAFDTVVVSDGEPDSESGALDEASRWTSPIHTIYIGEAGGDGEKFLARLSKATGGRKFTADTPGALMPGVVALLGDGGAR